MSVHSFVVSLITYHCSFIYATLFAYVPGRPLHFASVAAAPEYQRARSPEHKRQRRDAILAAARELASDRPVREVSLGDISRRVGLAKSNLLRYYESREEVFLRLLLDEWDGWRDDAEHRLRSRRATATSAAASLAGTLAGRPLFCDLISETSSVLERNVSVATVQAFKAGSLEKVDELGAVLAERLPALTKPQGRETVAAALIISAGLWPIANPPPHVGAMFAQIPELTRAHVDFADRLEHLLATLITGYIHSRRRPPRRGS
jgi:AcrR family transcriptional regulator